MKGLTPKLSRRRRGSMVFAAYRSGGRLECLVRPTLSQGLRACKREEVVAPRRAVPDARDLPPETAGLRWKQAGSRDQDAHDGWARPARAALRCRSETRAQT